MGFEEFKQDPKFDKLVKDMKDAGYSDESIKSSFADAELFVGKLFSGEASLSDLLAPRRTPEEEENIKRQMKEIAEAPIKEGISMMQSKNISLLSECKFTRFKNDVDPLLMELMCNIQQRMIKTMKMAIVSDLQDVVVLCQKTLEYMQEFTIDKDLIRELTEQERKELDNG